MGRQPFSAEADQRTNRVIQVRQNRVAREEINQSKGSGAAGMNIIVTYLSVTIAFVALDSIWLKTMGERLYRPVLGEILRTEPNLTAAAVFYLMYPIGLIGFAVLPAHYDNSAVRAFVSGSMFGFFTYATYDLTNQATLRSWSTTLTVADISWGSFLAGLSAWLGYLVVQRVGSSPW